MYDVCKAATWAGVEVGVCSIECVLYIMCVSTTATCAGVEVGVCETPFHQVVLHSATNEGERHGFIHMYTRPGKDRGMRAGDRCRARCRALLTVPFKTLPGI